MTEQQRRRVAWLGGDDLRTGIMDDELAARFHAINAAVAGEHSCGRHHSSPVIVAPDGDAPDTCDFCARAGFSHHAPGVLFLRDADGAALVTPALIGHWVEIHGYLPPPELLGAIAAPASAEDLLDMLAAAANR